MDGQASGCTTGKEAELPGTLAVVEAIVGHSTLAMTRNHAHVGELAAVGERVRRCRW